MVNCLVTRLKATVDNPNLDYFDSLRFRFNKTTFGYPIAAVYKSSVQFGGIGVVIKITSGNGYIKVGDIRYQEFTIDGITNASIDTDTPDDDFEFSLIGISKITKLWISYLGTYKGLTLKNPERLMYLVNPKSVLTYSNQGIMIYFSSFVEEHPFDESYINNIISDKSGITEFRYGGTGIPSVSSNQEYANYFKLRTTDLSEWTDLKKILFQPVVTEGDVSALENLVNLTDVNLRLKGIYGDVESFGKMTSVTNLNLNGSSVTGSVEDLVSAQYDNGRTNGTISFRCSVEPVNITFNGVRTAGGTLSWNSKTDITIS